MDYFYCPKVRGTGFSVEGEEVSHLVQVMRKKEGDEIRIVDGLGTAYDARIESVSRTAAAGTILRTFERHNEPALALTLAVGILKNPSKFDFLVEKATEVGVVEIIPLSTERTIASHAKSDRWQKLALAAMKQSGRSFLPRVTPLRNLSDLLAGNDLYDRNLFAHEQRDPSAPPVKAIQAKGSAIILVGPEGGFSDTERDLMLRAGYEQWYLGDRRLRTETAAIVTAAIALRFPEHNG